MLMAVGGPLALIQIGLVLLGLIGAAVVLRRRIERASASSARAVVRLTAQHAVHVLTVEGRTLVVGTGPSGGPTLIDAWPSPDTPAGGAGDPELRRPTAAWGRDG
jgi:hypothetical protein